MAYISWKFRKVNRGVDLAHLLLNEIDEWSRRNPPSVSIVVNASGHSVDYRLDFPVEIPLADWALRFGEIVHSFRSALDAYACSVARRNGTRDLSGVYFPVARNHHDWSKKIKAWGSTSATTSGRVEKLQPIRLHAGENLSDDFLSLIHDLDVLDKHRGMIVARGKARVRADEVSGTAPSGTVLGFLDNYLVKLTPMGGSVPLVTSSVPLSSANLTSARASFDGLTLSVLHKSNELALGKLLGILIIEMPKVIRYLESGYPAVAKDLVQLYADCRFAPTEKRSKRKAREGIAYSSTGLWSIGYSIGV